MNASRVNKVRAGDYNQGPFNHPFTDQEKKVLGLVERLRTTLRELRTELARTPINACLPAQNFEPETMEAIGQIENHLESLDLHLRWIPGGVYRHE